MKYRKVESYRRQRHLDFYRGYRSPFYSITFEAPVGALKAWIDERGWPTYLNLCYFFTRAAQGLADFRYRLLDGELVLYEKLHPGLTVPAPDGLFSFAHLEYDPDPEVFNARSAPVVAAARSAVELTETRHKNYLYFTAIPGISFTGFTHATDDPADGAPRVAFGRFHRAGGELKVPIGIQVNHLFIDGAVLGELAARVARQYGDPDRGPG